MTPNEKDVLRTVVEHICELHVQFLSLSARLDILVEIAAKSRIVANETFGSDFNALRKLVEDLQ